MKNLLQTSLIAILISFSITSCIKENIVSCTGSDCFIFEGQVFDSIKNLAISNARIEVILVYDNGSFGSINYKKEIVGKSKSDQDGNYRVAFSGERLKDVDGYFEIEISKQGYFDKTIMLEYVNNTSFDVPNIVDADIHRKAYLDVNIKTGEYIDNVQFSLPTGGDGQSTWAGLTNSSNRDTTYNFQVAGDQFTKVQYNYKRLGLNYSKSDSIYINGGEKRQLNIKIE